MLLVRASGTEGYAEEAEALLISRIASSAPLLKY